jgi:hypothetical protein
MRKAMVFSFIVLLALSFCFSNAFAWKQDATITQAGRLKVTENVAIAIIPATLLDNSPTSVTSATLPAGEYQKLAFFVIYDETQVGNTVSGTLTIEISWDNLVWQAASFYDYAGGATLQTSEVISADGQYYCWFNKDLAVPYVHAIFTGTNTDADDTILVTVNAYGLK